MLDIFVDDAHEYEDEQLILRKFVFTEYERLLESSKEPKGVTWLRFNEVCSLDKTSSYYHWLIVHLKKLVAQTLDDSHVRVVLEVSDEIFSGSSFLKDEAYFEAICVNLPTFDERKAFLQNFLVFKDKVEALTRNTAGCSYDILKQMLNHDLLIQNGILDPEDETDNDNFGFDAEVIGYDDARQELEEQVYGALKHSEKYQKLGITPCRGIILYGPNGNGKTTLCMELLSKGQYNCVTIDSAEVITGFLGESERQIREAFMRARKMAPSIVFIDDIDMLAKRREIDMDGGSIYSRVLSTFLNEIDGIQTQKDVIVLACTSKLDKIDEALLRPGRIDTMIHVDNPSKEDAEELLLHFCRKENYPYEDASKAFPTTEHFSVADIRAFVKQKSIEKFLQEC